MATQKATVTIVYVVNIKARTVVKVTAAVALTTFACHVIGDISAPHIQKLNKKLDRTIVHLREASPTVDH